MEAGCTTWTTTRLSREGLTESYASVSTPWTAGSAFCVHTEARRCHNLADGETACINHSRFRRSGRVVPNEQ